MKTLKPRSWFNERIDQRVFRDDSGCGCHSCNEIVENGIVIHDATHANYMFDTQNDYANDGTYLNYRDKK